MMQDEILSVEHTNTKNHPHDPVLVTDNSQTSTPMAISKPAYIQRNGKNEVFATVSSVQKTDGTTNAVDTSQMRSQSQLATLETTN